MPMSDIGDFILQEDEVECGGDYIISGTVYLINTELQTKEIMNMHCGSMATTGKQALHCTLAYCLSPFLISGGK